MTEPSSALNPSVIWEPPSNRFYRTVWRWHFYAGLFVVPFMLTLAATGIIYLFKPQLDTLMYRDRLFVQPAGEVMPYTAQLQVSYASVECLFLLSRIPALK